MNDIFSCYKKVNYVFFMTVVLRFEHVAKKTPFSVDGHLPKILPCTSTDDESLLLLPPAVNCPEANNTPFLPLFTS